MLQSAFIADEPEDWQDPEELRHHLSRRSEPMILLKVFSRVLVLVSACIFSQSGSLSFVGLCVSWGSYASNERYIENRWHPGGGTEVGRIDWYVHTLIAHSRTYDSNQRGTRGICTRRAGKLYKVRSRLCRSQILQLNTRSKALAEIYAMHSFAPFWNLNFFVKNCWVVFWFLQNFANLPGFCWIFAESC